ncbi:MAG: hypothetical protein WDZ80_02075, partial [Candidatus Paceibacterota bacterium]
MTEKNNGNNWIDWQKLIHKIAEQQSQIIKPTITPAIKQIQETVNRIAEQQARVAQNALKPLIDQFTESSKVMSAINISKLPEFQALLETVAKEVEEIPEYVDNVHAYLAQQGWFVPFHLAPISIFKEYFFLIENEEHEQIEHDLQNFITENISFIRSSVKKEFLKRFRIIDTAIRAHENGEYILSIPTLLAQADGMFSELIDMTFFSNKDSDLEEIRRRLLQRLAKKNHPTNTLSLGYLLIKQLQEKSIIHENFSEFERSKNKSFIKNPLNRNYILHGKDLEYDTEANSLRT